MRQAPHKRWKSSRIAAVIAILITSAGTAPLARAQSTPAAIVGVPAASVSQTSAFRLPNGLRVVVVPDHRLPVVTHMVWYAVGAADEAANEHGVAHYLEHMMFKGTAAYPKGQFDRFVGSRGGWHNATTSMDATVYYQRLPKSALAQIMAMEADRMANLQINDADVASERSVVLEEFRRKEVSISIALDKQMQAALYEGHPKSRMTIGTEAEIKALDGVTAQRFYERYYDPARATVVIGGDIDETEARALAEATYARVPTRKDLAERVVAPMPSAGVSQRFEASHERATSVRVSRIYLAPGDGPTDRRETVAANLFTYIAGNGMTSRMHRLLVNEKTLATSANCGFSYDSQASTFECVAWGNVGVTASALEPAFAGVLDDLAKSGVTDDEFEEIKSRFLATGAYRKDNVYDRANTLGSLLAEGRSIADVESLEADVASLTRVDVERAGQRILQQGRNVTGVLTPKSAAIAAKPTSAN